MFGPVKSEVFNCPPDVDRRARWIRCGKFARDVVVKHIKKRSDIGIDAAIVTELEVQQILYEIAMGVTKLVPNASEIDQAREEMGA